MIAEWIVFFIAMLFLLMTSMVMGFANRNRNMPIMVIFRPLIYALVTTLFLITIFTYRLYDIILYDGLGSVALVLGPLLIVGIGFRFLKRLAKIIRLQHIKSLPDFLAARYGKKYSISLVSTLIILLVALPFLGVQIWYLDYGTDVVIDYIDQYFLHDHEKIFVLHSHNRSMGIFKPIVLLFLIFIGLVAVISVRSKNGTDGLLAAIGMAIVAFFIVVCFYFFETIYVQFDGVSDVVDQFKNLDIKNNVIKSEFSALHFIVMILLGTFTFIATPWQFQFIFLENSNEQEIDFLRKFFVPFFLVFSLMIFGISMAAIVTFEGEQFKFALLTAALSKNSFIIGIFLYFISIITTVLLMVVELLAISTMIGNDILLPLTVRKIGQNKTAEMQTEKSIIRLKRVLIVVALILGYLFFIAVPQSQYNDKLTYGVSTLLFQLVPAFVGAIYWHKATSNGVFAGLIAGVATWVFTFVIPYLVEGHNLDGQIIETGLAGISWLRPTALFGSELSANTHAALWSVAMNILFFVIVSLAVKPSAEEQIQNRIFSDISENVESPEVQELQKNTNLYELQQMVGQYIGQDIAEIRFRKFAEAENIPYHVNQVAPVKFVKFTRQQLASAIGTSSARFVMALVLERKKNDTSSALKLLDEASNLIHLNRELLQSAIDNINQGICVLDENLKVTSWNKAFLSILNIPIGIMEQNSSLEIILEFCASRGDFGEGEVSSQVAERILNYVVLKKTVRENMNEIGQIIEVTSSAMPEGGCVITFDNVTAQVIAANELESANVNLEHRVEDRTNELTQLNMQLEKAKTEAEQANIDKTRFLAAASHDISQPMNAARLYSSALLEQEMDDRTKNIATSLDLSLTSVEEILVALLDISRLDSGVYKAEYSHFGLNELFEQLFIEFKPLAEKKNLKFRYVATDKFIYSDRRHLRRILQNLISNAVKYTESGTVLFGCRLKGEQIRIDVWDTGHGVAPFQIKTIFKEFKRLESGMRVAQGVGLGLSIVDRISKMINSELEIDSKVDQGSRFSCYVKQGVRPKMVAGASHKTVIPRNKLGPLNIVCIDNETEILKALKTLLDNWGVNGIYTETSKDALQEIEQRGIIPDAIIADYHLNFENGVFAIEKIRWQIDHPIQAILATADRSEQVMKVCQAKDITLMYKPLKPAILRAILARIEVPNK